MLAIVRITYCVLRETGYAIRNTQYAFLPTQPQTLRCTTPHIPRTTSLLKAIFITLITLLAATTPSPLHAAPPAQAPDTPPAVSGGRTLWSENCAPCHGPTGLGDGPTAQAIDNPMPNMVAPGLYRTRIPAEHFDIIKNGRIENMMPPWGNRFNDSQIWDLTAYVWSLHTTPESLASGAAIYEQQCASCHGPDGTGSSFTEPSEITDFTDLQVMAQRSLANLQAGFAASPAHEEISGLSEEEIWLAVDHLRTFSYNLPQRNGMLSGQVVNATAGRPQGNLDVTLYAFQDGAEVESRTGQADSEGNFTFEDLATDPGIVYVVEGQYGRVSYISDPSSFAADANQQTLDLEVYETTTSAESVSLSRLNHLVSVTPDAVRMVQVFVISNDSDKTYVGKNDQTFAFALPESATNVSFQNDFSNSRFVESDEGYITAEPIVPGEDGLIIAAVYDLPYSGDTLEVEVPVPAKVDSINVLVETQPGLDMQSPQLQFIETRQLQNSEFATYGGQNLAEGEMLTLEFSGLSSIAFEQTPSNIPPGAVAATPPLVDQETLRWAVLGLGGLALLVAGGLYPYLRPRLASTPDPAAHRRRLLLLLARLDDAFEAGEIDEQVYRQSRARYKAELINLR